MTDTRTLPDWCGALRSSCSTMLAQPDIQSGNIEATLLALSTLHDEAEPTNGCSDYHTTKQVRSSHYSCSPFSPVQHKYTFLPKPCNNFSNPFDMSSSFFSADSKSWNDATLSSTWIGSRTILHTGGSPSTAYCRGPVRKESTIQTFRSAGSTAGAKFALHVAPIVYTLSECNSSSSIPGSFPRSFHHGRPG